MAGKMWPVREDTNRGGLKLRLEGLENLKGLRG